MATPQEEAAAINELVRQINAWIMQHAAVYNKDLLAPTAESVTFAKVYLSDMGELIKQLPLSSTQVAQQLHSAFAFISSVRIEHEVKRILVVIDKSNPLFPI